MRALTLTILLLILASAPIHAATYHVSQAAANASEALSRDSPRLRPGSLPHPQDAGA